MSLMNNPTQVVGLLSRVVHPQVLTLLALAIEFPDLLLDLDQLVSIQPSFPMIIASYLLS